MYRLVLLRRSVSAVQSCHLQKVVATKTEA